MRRIGVVLATLLAACHSTSSPRSSPVTDAAMSGTGVRGPFRVRTTAGDVSRFQAVVPAVDTGGHCESVPAVPMLQSGQRALLYAFGQRASRRRNVMLIIDSARAPVRYSDIRGDLRGPNDASVSPSNPLGPRTTIALNFRDTTAFISNRAAGQDSVAMRVRGPTILVAPTLGVPANMIATILKECAGRL